MSNARAPTRNAGLVVNTNSLCRTFRLLSRAVWCKQREAHALGLSYSEETISESLLVETRRRHRYEVYVKKFTRNKESEVGADWEWWFRGDVGGKTKWLPLLVQAKRLHVSSNEYGGLRQRVRKSKEQQIDVLLKHARRERRYAMYCFYNYSERPTSGTPTPAPRPRPIYRRHGCTLAGADDIRVLLDANKTELDDVLPVSMPWCSLVCCSDSPSTVLPCRVLSALTKHRETLDARRKEIRKSQQSSMEAVAFASRRKPLPLPTLLDAAPAYVDSAAFDNSTPEREFYAQHHDESAPKHVGGVAIFSESSKE